MDWHFTARVILFRSMNQACCIGTNESFTPFTHVQSLANNRLQGKAAKNHCVTTTKYISTSLAIAARITLSITHISKVSL